MCGRYVVITKAEVLEKTFHGKVDFELKKVFNATPSMQLPVITGSEPNKIQALSFGFLPPWVKSKHKGLINIKSESVLKQGQNARNYHVLVKRAVLQSRCVVVANCFIEWHAQTKHPYVVYVRDQHQILFAGIHTTWKNPSTGEEMDSFGIITQEGNGLMQQIGRHRQPKILTIENYHQWLQASEFQDATALLNQRMEPGQMNAYPISTDINKPVNNSKDIISPIGERVLSEYDVKMKNKIKLFGMGQTPAKNRNLTK